jgi:Fur family ferric uptake transcriptional regulator
VKPEAAPMLAQAELKPTRQRIAIIDELAASEKPVTAQALHAQLSLGEHAPGLATVYRTLQAMVQAGLARTFVAREGEQAYKLCEPEHHHHLICERCGVVVEIPSCEVESWASSVAVKRGFVVRSHQADVYGLCARCLAGS